MLREDGKIEQKTKNYKLIKERIQSIDVLKGLCLILLVYQFKYLIEIQGYEGLNSIQRISENWGFFFLNFIGQPVAPIFLFLAGVGIYLYMKRRKVEKKKLSYYLFTRGLFLVILDLTIVSFSWSLSFNLVIIQVLFSIGISCILFSALLHIRRNILFLGSLFFVIFQEVIYTLVPFESLGFLGKVLISRFSFTLFDSVFVFYFPILISLAVLTLGYCMGHYFYSFDKEKRKDFFLKLSVFSLLSFLLLRVSNSFFEPKSWFFQDSFFQTIVSFFTFTKYPYSLVLLLFASFFCFYLLYLFEYLPQLSKKSPFLVFGSSPLFFYLAHIYVIHFLLFLRSFYSKTAFSFFELVFFYLLVVFLLYPLCFFYQKFKKMYFPSMGNIFKSTIMKSKKIRNERTTGRDKSS
jgi:uncharacterized membrane protein